MVSPNTSLFSLNILLSKHLPHVSDVPYHTVYLYRLPHVIYCLPHVFALAYDTFKVTLTTRSSFPFRFFAKDTFKVSLTTHLSYRIPYTSWLSPTTRLRYRLAPFLVTSYPTFCHAPHVFMFRCMRACGRWTVVRSGGSFRRHSLCPALLEKHSNAR